MFFVDARHGPNGLDEDFFYEAMEMAKYDGDICESRRTAIEQAFSSWVSNEVLGPITEANQWLNDHELARRDLPVDTDEGRYTGTHLDLHKDLSVRVLLRVGDDNSTYSTVLARHRKELDNFIITAHLSREELHRRFYVPQPFHASVFQSTDIHAPWVPDDPFKSVRLASFYETTGDLFPAEAFAKRRKEVRDGTLGRELVMPKAEQFTSLKTADEYWAEQAKAAELQVEV